MAETVDDHAIFLLIRHGLAHRFPDACSEWNRDYMGVQNSVQKALEDAKIDVVQKLNSEKDTYEQWIHSAIKRDIGDHFP